MRFITDLSKGILGAGDSTEMWKEIISHIPDELLLKPNVKILSVACGHGTEAAIISRRMIALGISKERVRSSIYLIDKYRQFTRYVTDTYGFTNVITGDFLQQDFRDMRFDLVVGNPPYQKGDGNIGAPLWPQFIQKSIQVCTDGGIVAMVTPSTWLNKSMRGAWRYLRQTDIIYLEPNAKKYFPDVGGNGGTFSYFITVKRPSSGKTHLSCNIQLDIETAILPANTTTITQENIEFIQENIDRVLPLQVHSGPMLPSINGPEWSVEKTPAHIYECYYSGRPDRRTMWCTQPVGHYGEWKLVVASSGNIYNSLEITQKGAGRQTNYVLGDKKYLESLRTKLLSDRSKKLSLLMQEGNYNNALKFVLND